MSEEFLSKTLVFNLESQFWLIREFISPMLMKNQGHIVCMNSCGGISGYPMLTDFAASKFGSVGLMESLRLEMLRGNHDIKCTTVCPYFTNTGQVDTSNCAGLFRMLDKDYVVWRTIAAIRQEEGEVCMPWSLGCVLYFTKLFLPSSLQDRVKKHVLGLNSMDHFQVVQAKAKAKAKKRK